MVQCYLFIFEDGSLKFGTEVTEEDIQGADDGYLQIVNVTDPAEPQEYTDGRWVALEEVSRED